MRTVLGTGVLQTTRQAHKQPASTKERLLNHVDYFITLLLKIICPKTLFEYDKPGKIPMTTDTVTEEVMSCIHGVVLLSLFSTLKKYLREATYQSDN